MHTALLTVVVIVAMLVGQATQPAKPQQDQPQAEVPRHRLTPPVQPGRQDVPAEAALEHEATRLVFPPRLGEAPRIGTASYDGAARNLSASYRQEKIGMVVTIYVYPAPAAAPEAFDAELRQIEAIWQGLTRSEISLEIGDLGPPLVGAVHATSLSSEGPAMNMPHAITTYLAVAEVRSHEPGQKYLAKLRATINKEKAEEANQALIQIATEWLASNGFDLEAQEPQAKD